MNVFNCRRWIIGSAPALLLGATARVESAPVQNGILGSSARASIQIRVSVSPRFSVGDRREGTSSSKMKGGDIGSALPSISTNAGIRYRVAIDRRSAGTGGSGPGLLLIITPD